MTHFKRKHRRNNSLVDLWSLTHLGWGLILGILIEPLWALAILVLWEPLEIFVLSPILKRYLKVTFGFESLRNSLSDIFFDCVGVIAAVLILR